MAKRYQTPVCHPDRVHQAKGLCRECYYKKNKTKLNKQKVLRSRLNPKQTSSYKKLVMYKLSPEKFEEMFIGQSGRCVICDREMVRWKNNSASVVIDHDHTCCFGKRSCGKCTRGLICSDCNRGLGSFHDDPISLLRAIEYLLDFRFTEPKSN